MSMSMVMAPVVCSFEQWRDAARNLLARRVAPEYIVWRSSEEQGDLLSVATAVTASTAPASQTQGQAQEQEQPQEQPLIRLPRQLLAQLESASCHNAADRWRFLYQVLWRWQQGEHEVMSPADVDGARLHAMVKAVHREEHDMHAYIRFRERKEEDGAPRFVAWFEPNHHVLPQVAGHFARRMGNVTWMIATPQLAVLWDGNALHEAPSLLRGAADIEDAGEALWLTYYRSIFNPARLNADLLHSHIPARFWKHLPEGAIVPAMISAAANGERRTGQLAAVGQRGGTAIAIRAELAQPQRQQASTLDQCRGCALWNHATQAVAGVGPQPATMMLVGEQPGDQEDLQGLVGVGSVGSVLEQAMAEAGLDRRSMYLTYAVKHFKWLLRGKQRFPQTPTAGEISACHHWLEQELALVQPQVVVALGSTALQSILQDGSASLQSFLGTAYRHNGRLVVAVGDPAEVLCAPDEVSRRGAYRALVEGLRLARQQLEPTPM